MFPAALFIIESNQDVLQLVNQLGHVYNRVLFSNTKKWTTEAQVDMEEPQLHMAKWKKPTGKCYIWYDSDYVTFRNKQTVETVKRSGVVGDLRWGRDD